MTEADSTQRDAKYDIVIFGASGFTGQFVVDEVAKTIGEEKDLKWAIAGRNMAKLQSVLRQAGQRTGKDLEELPIIIANLDAPETLVDMAKETKVVLNCTGPYRFYGDKVIRACIEGGSHHIDISGEPGFLEKTEMLYKKKAQEKGLYLVGSCGFDSIPADLGVLFTQQKFKGILNAVEGYLGIKAGPMGGKGHFATWQSAVHGFASAKETGEQRKLIYPEPLPKPKHKMPRRGNLFYSEDVKSWCFPFPGSDRSVVYRSQYYNHHVRLESKTVQFNAFVRLPSLFSAIMVGFVGAIFGLLASFGLGRKLLETFPRFFSFGMFSHDGPTTEQMAGTSFSYTFYGYGYAEVEGDKDPTDQEPTKTIVTRVAGPEPGYVSTPICMVQAAYALLANPDKLPHGGGVYTPANAFGKTDLIDRLDRHDVKFVVIKE